MVIAEVAASVVECLIITDFIIRFLEMKNDKFGKTKFMLFFALLFLDNMLSPALFEDELIPIVIMIAIGMIYRTPCGAHRNLTRVCYDRKRYD